MRHSDLEISGRAFLVYAGLILLLFFAVVGGVLGCYAVIGLVV